MAATSDAVDRERKKLLHDWKALDELRDEVYEKAGELQGERRRLEREKELVELDLKTKRKSLQEAARSIMTRQVNLPLLVRSTASSHLPRLPFLLLAVYRDHLSLKRARFCSIMPAFYVSCA